MIERFSERFSLGRVHPPPRVRPPVGRTPSTVPPVSSHGVLKSPHTEWGRLRRDLHSLRALYFAPPSPRHAPPRFDELSGPLHRVFGQASPPRAPPRRPLPRRPLLSLSRAPVRPHCQLRRELHLAGVHTDHRQRGQTSLVHLWP